MFEVFFRKKPALILVALRRNTKNRYGSNLAKEVDCTYSHAVKILQDMEKAKLVSFEKHGRIKAGFFLKKTSNIVSCFLTNFQTPINTKIHLFINVSFKIYFA